MSHLPLLLVTFLLLATSFGCATRPATASASASTPGAVAAIAPAGPHVFPTVEAAVEDALASADLERGPANRERFRFGTIRRVPGGFAWTPPVRSRTTVGARRPQGVRLPLGPEDVAIYGLHPRSGRSELDRVNERLSRQEQRAIDGQDGAARPLYVLTPSRRIVRYPERLDATPEALELVRRDPTGGP